LSQPLPPSSTSRPPPGLAGFQVSITGRFWVSTEGRCRTRKRVL
jgi:hypothetical protein